MSVTSIAQPAPKAQPPLKTSNLSPEERRQRRRAKITAQLLVRFSGPEVMFEEVCKSIDISRDGLLFTATRSGYAKGQRVDVVFPYSSDPTAPNQGQQAEVVRVIQHSAGQFSVAVQFANAKQGVDAKINTTHKAHHAEAGQPVKQSTVLAIETDSRAGDIMRNMLEQDGYTVVIVPGAQQAIDFMRTNVPNVLLAEVEAEDMSGHDLCAIIKQNHRLARIPVILLTRSAQPADYSTSHKLGAVVCMAKPFQPERLQQVVRMVAPPPALRGSNLRGMNAGMNRKTA